MKNTIVYTLLLCVSSLFFSHTSRANTPLLFPDKEFSSCDTIPQNGDASEKIYKVVEKMPHFPGCDDSADKKECSQRLLIEYISENLVYPEAAKKDGTVGKVVLQFVITSEGRVRDVTILRDIGSGCGEEAARVVEKMNDDGIVWSPGTQRGKPVSILYTLPVSFKL